MSAVVKPCRGRRSQLLKSVSSNTESLFFQLHQDVYTYMLEKSGHCNTESAILFKNTSFFLNLCLFLTLKNTSTGHFTRYTPPLLPWDDLIIHCIDSTSCSNHSSELLVHIDMMPSHTWCRFGSCTYMMWIFVPLPLKGALSDRDLANVEVNWA